MKTIPLTRGLSALVDDEDFNLVSSYRWYAHVGPYKTYAAREIRIAPNRHKTVFMQHLLIERPEGLLIDHINGDGLDNQRANMRLATKSQNGVNCPVRKHNRLGVKGVYVLPGGRYRAQIAAGGGARKHLGVFDTAAEAHAAWLRASIEKHGEFARAV